MYTYLLRITAPTSYKLIFDHFILFYLQLLVQRINACARLGYVLVFLRYFIVISYRYTYVYEKKGQWRTNLGP